MSSHDISFASSTFAVFAKDYNEVWSTILIMLEVGLLTVINAAVLYANAITLSAKRLMRWCAHVAWSMANTIQRATSSFVNKAEVYLCWNVEEDCTVDAVTSLLILLSCRSVSSFCHSDISFSVSVRKTWPCDVNSKDIPNAQDGGYTQFEFYNYCYCCSCCFYDDDDDDDEDEEIVLWLLLLILLATALRAWRKWLYASRKHHTPFGGIGGGTYTTARFPRYTWNGRVRHVFISSPCSNEYRRQR